MSIRDIAEKIKGMFSNKGAGQGSTVFRLPKLNIIPDDLFLGLIIILVAFGAFGLGRLSKIEGAKTPIRVENAPEVSAGAFNKVPASSEKVQDNSAQSASVIGATMGQFVASKSGKKYYYPWCTGVQKIKEENRIYFASKTEAEVRGYTPSSTCKGL